MDEENIYRGYIGEIHNEEDLSKYRIYLLMLLEQFIRSYFVDEKNFGDYWHLFKLYD